MTGNNETVAEIVGEMRRDAVAADAWCETHGEMASAASVLNRHADRIEAAHKSEVAELRECMKEAVEYFCGHDKADCTEKVYGHPSCETEGHHCMVERWRKAMEGVSHEETSHEEE